MWRWTLNWGEIRSDIVIGTCPMTAGDLHRIHSETGADGVLSLQHDECLSYWGIDYDVLQQSGRRLGIRMARCPIRDFDIPDMRRRLPDAVSLLSEMIARTRRVYVHCTAGMGRAPLAVLGYLALIEGLASEAAMRLIREGRPEAVPSLEALEGCREDLTARYAHAIERRAFALYESGDNQDASADWAQARAEILRSVMIGDAGA